VNENPRLVIFGQILIDDVVPAYPGLWSRQLGGNALYAAAGARFVLSAGTIGVVSRIGRTMPFDVCNMLEGAGIRHAISSVDNETLIEWILYEEDGSRYSMPRNRSIRKNSSEVNFNREAYLSQLEAQSPTVNDMPPAWINAGGFHLAPQVYLRHQANLAALKGKGFVSLDPSPHYIRGLSIADIYSRLEGVSVFMPSEQEINHLVRSNDLEGLITITTRLYNSGFPEVIVKVGDKGCLVAGQDGVELIPAELASNLVDPTGAGDAFCGAYTACRIQGDSPIEAARKAVVVGKKIVESSGVEEALELSVSTV